MRNIPYGKQSITEEDIEAVCSVLRSDWLTQGPKVQEFEEALAKECGARHCVLVSNGTMALHLACMALDFAPRDVGLTSPISFLSSAYCVTLCGGRADFVDIDPETLCLSPGKVEAYCENNPVPKVVIPVDFAGVPADLPKYRLLAEKYGFKLIEDAAHAIGSTYRSEGNEYACGSCAHVDMAVFSFHPVKTITTGEGGAILTNDDDLADKLRRLANHGIERDPAKLKNLPSENSNPKSASGWYYEMQSLGYNGRITDFQSALGLSQLRRLGEVKRRRQEIVREYNRALENLAKEQVVTLPPWPEGTDPCFHLYPLRLGPRCKIGRDDLYSKLKEKGIFSQIHYIPIYRQPYYQEKGQFKPEQFPESEKYYATCLSLPLFPDMDGETLHYVTETLHSLL